MTTRVAPSAARHGRVEPLATALEQQGLLDPRRHDEALDVLAGALGHALDGEPSVAGQAEPVALRRRLVELAGYVGGAFVVAAAILFTAQEWTDLSVTQRVGLLGGAALLLTVVGVAIVLVTGGRLVVREPVFAARRRLAATLLTAAGFAAAAAVLVAMVDWVERTSSEEENGELIGLASSGTLLVLVLLGYLYLPSLAGQLAAAVATMYLVPFALMATGLEGAVLHGLAVVLAGGAWLVLAETGRWHETSPARVVGVAMLVAGAQIPIGSADHPWVAYATLATVAVVGLGLCRAPGLAVPGRRSGWVDARRPGGAAGLDGGFAGDRRRAPGRRRHPARGLAARAAPACRHGPVARGAARGHARVVR